MKRIYFLALLCCIGFTARSQVTVTIWATATSGTADTTATVTSTTFTPGDMVVTSNTSQGYAVFDLNVIPANATITSVIAGIDVNTYIPGTTDLAWNTYGYSGDLSTFAATPPALFGNMTPPATFPGGPLYNAASGGAYGPFVGDPVFTSTPQAVSFIQSNVSVPTPGRVSLTYTTVAATNAQYYITGESGGRTTSTGHAPYITVTYCAVPSGVTAVASPNPVCDNSTLNLVGTATNATNYTWTGPNGYSSPSLTSSLITSLASAGTYTLTAANVCGALTNSVVVTTASVTVTPGPITGVTNCWAGFTTQLSDPTPGGIWSTSNPGAATVSATGLVTGVSAGASPPANVVISYVTPSGCVFSANVQVNQSLFSELPTVDPSAIGLGFPIVAWYPFCGDTQDYSHYPLAGGSNLLNYSVVMPGPLVTAPITTTPATLTTDRFGIPNDAYYFNGATNMMQYNTYFPISGPTGDYTYSVWFEADTEQNSVILYNGNLGGYTSVSPPYSASNGWGFVINDGTPSPYNLPTATPPGAPVLYNSGPGNFVSVLFGGIGQYVTTPVTLHQWHNLMLKKNGGSYDFYVDNVSVGFFIEPYVGMSAASGSIFRLGMDSTGTKAFKGKIDDIAIYNRQLSTTERDSLYNFNPDARAFTLGADTTICADSFLLVPKPPTVGNDYRWVNAAADTFSVDSAVWVNPSPGAAGNVYTLFVGKPYGCHTNDAINIYKNPIPIHVGPNTMDLCIGDTATLGDASFPGATFIWSTGDSTHSIKVTTTGIYSVVADSGICIGHDTVNVRVFNKPIIGLASNYAHCQGTPDTLTPVFDTGYVYSWSTALIPNFSDSSYIVDTIIGATTFFVKVTDTVIVGGPVGGAISVNPPDGCSAMDTTTVLIVYDTLTFLQTDTAICKGESWPPAGQFMVTNNFIANYQWTPSTGMLTSNVYDPVITPDTSAKYVLTVTYPGCPDIVNSFNLDVQPPPTISLPLTRNVCQGDTIHILAQVTPSWYRHYNYNWFPSTYLDSSNTQNVILMPDTASDTILMHVTVSTPLGLTTPPDLNCISSDSMLIYVHPSKFDSTIGSVNLCPGDSAQLISLFNSTGINDSVVASYVWQPGLYLSDATSSSPWAYAVTTTNYQLVATSTYGCKDTNFVTVKVYPAAVIYLGDSVTLYPGESYQISPQTNCVNFSWYPPLGLNLTTVSNPVATPEVHTKYYVTASTEDGCSTYDSLVIRVDPGEYINIPNAFTPGAGINNKFMVLKKGLVGINYFRVFDRWGAKVFETTNIDDGWDGTFNGKPQPFGVYVYEVEAVATNGKVYDRMGNVTLIR